MKHELLQRLMITPLYEPDEETLEFINSKTYGDLEDSVKEALQAYRNICETTDAEQAKLSSLLMKTNVRLAEVAAKVIGIEQGLRVGRVCGQRLIEGAYEFAELSLRQYAPLLEDGGDEDG